MDKSGKWFFAAILVIVLGLGITGLVNYIIDPYGIFRKDFSWQFIEPNKHYIKARYVSRYPDRYNCFLFASSRGNNMDARKMGEGKCYNMQYSGGLPREHLNVMKYLVKRDVDIKLAVIALDEFSFEYSPREHLSQPMRHPYPPVLHEPLFPYYLQYLFFWYDWKIMKVCLKGYADRLLGKTDEGSVQHDIFETGQTFAPAEDAVIEQNPLVHAAKPAFRKRFQSSPVYMDGVIKDLQDLVEFARENRIQLKFLVVPFYVTKYLDAGPDELDRFKRALSRMADFWDFSGFNSITTNKYYHYETWHFRSIVGDMILARMFGQNNVSVPEDFGVFVTAQNIEGHLQKLRGQMKEYLKKERQ